MKPSRTTGMTALAFSGALLLAMLASAPARAEFIQFSTVAAPNVTVTPGGATITLTGRSSNSPGDNIDAQSPGTDIVFGKIDVTGVTSSSKLEAININYSFQITIENYLTDTAPLPNGSNVFTVNGTISGSIGSGKKVNISSNTSNITGGNSIILPIAGEVYQLSLGTYVPPGPTEDGSFGAHVELLRIPEPSTMVLFGLGFMALATPAIRRWRGSRPRAV